jgi:hypothetical protein
MATHTKKDIIKNAVKYGVPVTTLGVGVANLSINKARYKKDRKYQEEQLKAMNRLTNSLNKTNSNLSQLNSDNFPFPEEPKKRRFLKFFSVRDNNINFRRKVDLEGILGDNKLDELRDWLLEKSSDPRLQTGLTYSTEDYINSVSYPIPVNSDPKGTIVNLLYCNGVLEILFVNPKPDEVSRIDKVLDEYCSKHNEEVGYIATQPAHSIFHVEIKLKEGTESEVPEMLREEGFKINVLINKNK